MARGASKSSKEKRAAPAGPAARPDGARARGRGRGRGRGPKLAAADSVPEDETPPPEVVLEDDDDAPISRTIAKGVKRARDVDALTEPS